MVILKPGNYCVKCGKEDCYCPERQSDGTWLNPGAMRFDDNKPEFALVPPGALEEIAMVMTRGAKKYERGNWQKGMAWSRVMNSLMRHYAAFQKGENVDKESGLPHMAHVAVNAMFLLEYARTHPELDDRDFRPKNDNA